MSDLTAIALKLSVPERVQLVQDLWDSIAAQGEVCVSAENVPETERRLGKYEANPQSALSWETVQAKWNEQR